MGASIDSRGQWGTVDLYCVRGNSAGTVYKQSGGIDVASMGEDEWIWKPHCSHVLTDVPRSPKTNGPWGFHGLHLGGQELFGQHKAVNEGSVMDTKKAPTINIRLRQSKKKKSCGRIPIFAALQCSAPSHLDTQTIVQAYSEPRSG